MSIDALSPTTAAFRRSMWVAFFTALFAALFAVQAAAQAPAAPGGAAPPPPATELESLVGRIALYPDDLVAIILPASTNPLQVVQADRFLEKRKSDKNLKIDEKWDDSVKALVNYPDVVKMMSNDLDWTSALGEAVAADSGEVMAAVQAFRRKVNAAGNLKTDDKQKVVVEQEIIKIEQANPEVIYVPQYNPSTVVVYGGYSSWGYYPAPYPVYYYPYPPGAALAAGIVWGAALGAVWGGGHWNCGWGGNEININRNVNVSGGDRTNISNRPSQGSGSSQKWKSDKQPGQVSKSVGKTPSTRVGDARGGSGAGAGAGAGRGGAAGASASTRDVGGAGGRDAGGAVGRDVGGAGGRDGGGAGGRDVGGASAGARDAGGGRSPAASTSYSSRGGSGGGGGSAFDAGGSSARSAQANSSRGASSRSSMSSGGGGARGGGGGRGGRR